MSFRLFIYYCALCGGGGAFAGWVFGRAFTESEGVVAQGYKGMWLGVALALALALVDALWNFALRQVLPITLRVLTAVCVGGLAGLFGGLVGQALYSWQPWGACLVFGWTVVGLLIGLSLGVFDLLASLALGRDPAGAIRKTTKTLLGGTIGGIAGGSLSLFLRSTWTGLLQDKPSDLLWSPSALGFVALGGCIGLMIGLAQVLFKEAWLKVEAGFRAGREIILSKNEIIIGRAEACDIGLFGDSSIDKTHARIIRQGNDYFLTDAASTTGTYINEERIYEPRRLYAGDVIRVGRAILRFDERQKKTP
jgi:hypothetical protein